MWKELSGPANCKWPKCTSKATFNYPRLLVEHTLNLHDKPLVCPTLGCSHRKPFGKRSDLKRHIRTKHENAQAHKCPVQGCDSNVTGFSRKDKMLKHMREKHTLLKCGLNHCFDEVPEAETETHLQLCHGSLECAIGACKNADKSYFSGDNLIRHLRTSHSVQWSPARSLFWTAEDSEDKTVRSELPESWKYCKSCSSRQETKGVEFESTWC